MYSNYEVDLIKRDLLNIETENKQKVLEKESLMKDITSKSKIENELRKSLEIIQDFKKNYQEKVWKIYV